jgi:hypothetical protein
MIMHIRYVLIKFAIASEHYFMDQITGRDSFFKSCMLTALNFLEGRRIQRDQRFFLMASRLDLYSYALMKLS